MKKSILYTAGALAFCELCIASPAAAQSSVTLYGAADEWVGMQKPLGGKTAVVLGNSGDSPAFLGFKGREDLGSGYYAIFTLQAFLRMTSGAYGRYNGDSFFSRNSYAGIEAPWGTVTAGRMATLINYNSVSFNPMGDSTVFSPMITRVFNGVGNQTVLGDSDWNNAVRYVSPNLKGFVGSALYAFGGAAGEAGQNKWSLSAAYYNGRFSSSIVYQTIKYNLTADDLGASVAGLTSQSVAEVNVAYDFSLFKLYGEYLYLKDNVKLGGMSNNTGQVGFTIPVGVGTVKGSYVYSENSQGTVGQGKTRNIAALMYDYPLSVRTEIYAAYAYDHFTGLSSGQTLGVGILSRF
ncbi:porin [Paraburkholderia aspalathi]|jgi:predicted porin|uniref:Outer membrane protein (Porin) n=1 Tax=Paraburkholderia aspalathi TaxID=1324617 RepID=A0A1I7DC14_9BURK|nr:porin [Paraburkholderia aspalathi]SFU09124.1 Outer membrane protein (porin) [Paraburkholderia aspalathi]